MNATLSNRTIHSSAPPQNTSLNQKINPGAILKVLRVMPHTRDRRHSTKCDDTFGLAAAHLCVIVEATVSRNSTISRASPQFNLAYIRHYMQLSSVAVKAAASMPCHSASTPCTLREAAADAEGPVGELFCRCRHLRASSQTLRAHPVEPFLLAEAPPSGQCTWGCAWGKRACDACMLQRVLQLW